MKLAPEDTIVSIATPVGEGAISIVRVSGPMAIPFCDRVFVGSVKLADTPGYTIRHGTIRREDLSIVDEVLVSVYRAPHSYTGEDSVEISCHGGMLVTAEVLKAVLKVGARQAQPGEYSKRAFLNGKIDLSKAEAIASIISARTKTALRISVEHLEGRLQEKVDAIRADLIDLCSVVELELDFAGEDVTLLTSTEILHKSSLVKRSIEELIFAFENGRLLREGASIVITGSPNVGKSSLFNKLLNTERAIVSHIPGTTRDLLEENLTLNGILFRLTDTAGIRESDDIIESQGVSRARAKETASDISIEVIDGANERGSIDIPKSNGDQRHRIIAINKLDLLDQKVRQEWKARAGSKGVLISAKTGEGLENLTGRLCEVVSDNGIVDSEVTVGATTQRQRDALESGLRHIEDAQNVCTNNGGSELVAFELRECLSSISEITGEVTTDEILNRVFGQFCIGK